MGTKAAAWVELLGLWKGVAEANVRPSNTVNAHMKVDVPRQKNAEFPHQKIVPLLVYLIVMHPNGGKTREGLENFWSVRYRTLAF